MVRRMAAWRVVLLAIVLLAAPVQAAEERWIATWAASPMRLRASIPASLTNVTIRQTVRVSLGGARMRVRFSNEFGVRPLAIGAASVALAAEDGTILPGSQRPLAFAGHAMASVSPGAPMLSDPVALSVPAQANLVVNLYLPQSTEVASVHADARQTAWISTQGNFTNAEIMPGTGSAQMRFFLSGVEVTAARPTRVIVVFGDSITDGGASTPDANNRWPDHLARRLLGAGRDIAVVNAGISGNRLLREGEGPSALARFDRDVLGWPNATHVIVMLGINDIGWPGAPHLAPASEAVGDTEIIGAYRQLIARGHARGLKVIGATLTPFEDTLIAQYYTPQKDDVRQAVNAWIRSSGAFDAVIDFDAILRDPARPGRIRPAYDSGDHLHPGDAGYKAMADGVDLAIFGE